MSLTAASSRHVLGVALLLAAAVGCRSTRTSAQSEALMLSVQNSSDFQVNVFAVPSAPTARIRLGSVAPLSSGQLRLPQSALGPGGELKVMVDPVGSTSEWMSPGITVSADTRACLRVMADASGDLGRSTLSTQIGDGSSCP